MKKILFLFSILFLSIRTFGQITIFQIPEIIVVLPPGHAPDCPVNANVFQVFISGISSGQQQQCGNFSTQPIVKNNDSSLPNGSVSFNGNGCNGINVTIGNLRPGCTYTLELTGGVTGFIETKTKQISVPQVGDLGVQNVILELSPSPRFCFSGGLRMIPNNLGCRTIVDVNGNNGTPYLKYSNGTLRAASNANSDRSFSFNFLKPDPNLMLFTRVKDLNGTITEITTPVPGGGFGPCPTLTLNPVQQVSKLGCNDGAISGTFNFGAICSGHGEAPVSGFEITMTRSENGESVNVPIQINGTNFSASNLPPGVYNLRYRIASVIDENACISTETVTIEKPACSGGTIIYNGPSTLALGCSAGVSFTFASPDCFDAWGVEAFAVAHLGQPGQPISFTVVGPPQNTSPTATIRYFAGGEECPAIVQAIPITFTGCDAAADAIQLTKATSRFCADGSARVMVLSEACVPWTATFYKGAVELETITAGLPQEVSEITKTGLAAGDYTVYVDFGGDLGIAGCSFVKNVTIEAADNELCGGMFISSKQLSHKGCNDGEITGIIENTPACLPGYTVTISKSLDGQTTGITPVVGPGGFQASNLSPGAYHVSIQWGPEGGCTEEHDFNITNPPCAGGTIIPIQVPSSVQFNCTEGIRVNFESVDCFEGWSFAYAGSAGNNSKGIPINLNITGQGPATATSGSVFYSIGSDLCEVPVSLPITFNSCQAVAEVSQVFKPMGPSLCNGGSADVNILSLVCGGWSATFFKDGVQFGSPLAAPNTDLSTLTKEGLSTGIYTVQIEFGIGGLTCGTTETVTIESVPEICNDGIDNNCNGQTDEGCNPNQAPTPVPSSPSTNFVNPTPVTFTFGQNRPSATQTPTTADPIIYYTTDGTTPVPGSPLTKTYTGPILVDRDMNVKAKAFQEGLEPSIVVSNFYTVTNPAMVAKPIISPNGGTSDVSATVTLSTTTPGAQLFYTTNGNAPRFDVPNSFTKLYSGPFTLTGSATVKAVGIKSGSANSPAASANFTINSAGIVVVPTFTPAPGTFAGPQSITLTTSTPGTQIYYTANGNVPRLDVPNSFTKLYSGPFMLTGSATLRAVGVKNGLQNSAIAVGIYTIGAVRKAVDENDDPFYLESIEAETERADARLVMIPNPTSGKVTLRFSGSETSGNITVLNMLGQAVLSKVINESDTEIDLSNQPSGMYLVRFQSEKTIHDQKLIKQ